MKNIVTKSCQTTLASRPHGTNNYLAPAILGCALWLGLAPAVAQGAEGDSPLDFYSVDGDPVDLALPGNNLSGITWNWDSGTYFTVQNNTANITEISSSLTVLRTITTTGFGDAEDLVYLGNQEFAIVNEASRLFIGEIPDAATSVHVNSFQILVFDDPGGNSGPEGVAFDPDTERFFIAKEKNPMKAYVFPRPVVSDDMTIVPDLLFDAATVLGPHATDLSAVQFDPRTGRLLFLSHESHRIIDVSLDGTVFSVFDLADSTQHEGLTLVPDHRILVVSEPAWFRQYSPSSDPFVFADGFESANVLRWTGD